MRIHVRCFIIMCNLILCARCVLAQEILPQPLKSIYGFPMTTKQEFLGDLKLRIKDAELGNPHHYYQRIERPDRVNWMGLDIEQSDRIAQIAKVAYASQAHLVNLEKAALNLQEADRLKELARLRSKCNDISEGSNKIIIDGILTDEQSRLYKVALWRAQSFHGLLNDPTLATYLGITKNQRTKIISLYAEAKHYFAIVPPELVEPLSNLEVANRRGETVQQLAQEALKIRNQGIINSFLNEALTNRQRKIYDQIMKPPAAKEKPKVPNDQGKEREKRGQEREKGTF